MKKSSIYTRTGDSGTTGLIGGTRVSKNDIRIEAYGTIDELNSFIGLLRSYLTDEHDRAVLLGIQNRLFRVGSSLATDVLRVDSATIGIITSENVKSIETEIDRINDKIPPHKSFIIPGGNQGSAMAHVCRTVCRRAERRIYAFRDEQHPVNEELLAYINRLSDYFFLLSRKVNIDDKVTEILWDNTCK
jgi:cob(I)alamin adenosyltransferase